MVMDNPPKRVLRGTQKLVDAQQSIGEILVGEARRDAVHFALLPIKAARHLAPGAHVGVDQDGKATNDGPHLGIVDPFLKVMVQPGQRFWLFLYPNTITSLRHVWEHPHFQAEPDASAKAVSEKWLRDFCDNSDCPGYETVIAAALENDDPNYLHFGEDASGSIPHEFWEHVEVVTGKNVRARPHSFSCSC